MPSPFQKSLQVCQTALIEQPQKVALESRGIKQNLVYCNFILVRYFGESFLPYYQRQNE